jgi:RNA polymerase-binding transcription factor DksA
MALTLLLGKAHTPPDRLNVAATVTLDDVGGVPTIVSSALRVDGWVPQLDAAGFQKGGAEATVRGHRPHRGSGTPTQPVLRAGLVGIRTRNSNCERTTEVTSTVQDPIDLLRASSEEQDQRSTDQLAELTVRSRQPAAGPRRLDDDTLAALIASARQTVSDTAQAPRRMAKGSYDTGERCTTDIPLQRLEILPHARFCLPCQRRQTG